jgi:hypothetical protein
VELKRQFNLKGFLDLHATRTEINVLVAEPKAGYIIFLTSLGKDKGQLSSSYMKSVGSIDSFTINTCSIGNIDTLFLCN